MEVKDVQLHLGKAHSEKKAGGGRSGLDDFRIGDTHWHAWM